MNIVQCKINGRDVVVVKNGVCYGAMLLRDTSEGLVGEVIAEGRDLVALLKSVSIQLAAA